MLHAPLLIQQAGIIHGFTTKQTPGTSHLYTVGDKPAQVKNQAELEQNIVALQSALQVKADTPITLLQQIHSDHIITLASAPEIGAWPVGDALITKIPNLIIGVQTADCIPILIYEPKARIIAAIHAGWRGVAQSIVEKAVNELSRQGASPSKMIAALGPSIQHDSYEIGSEVRDELLALGKYDEYFTPLGNGKYLLDLPGIVKAQLARMGVKTIDDLRLDTYTSPQFFSHRAYTHGKQQQVGRMVALISLR